MRFIRVIPTAACVTFLSAVSLFAMPPITSDPGVGEPGGIVLRDPTTLARNYIITDTYGNRAIYSHYRNNNYTVSISSSDGSNTTFSYRNINFNNKNGKESVIINNRYTLVWNTTNGIIDQLWINNMEIGHKDNNGDWITNQTGITTWQTCNVSIINKTQRAFRNISDYINQNNTISSNAFAPMHALGCGLAVAEYIASWVTIGGCAESLGLGCVLGVALHAHAGVEVARNCA